MDFGDQHIGGAIKIEDVAPPAAAGAAALGGVDEQWIDAKAADADIIDLALRGAELGPGALPRIAQLDAGRRAARDHDRDQQHRRRAAPLPANPEQLAGARAIEQHAERRDVAVGADLLALDDDRTDQPVERRIGEVGRFAQRTLVGLGPQRPEAFALSDAPSGKARRIGGVAPDIDRYTANFERSATVDRQDTALGTFHLREQHAAGAHQRQRGSDGEEDGPAEQHQRAFGDNGVEIQARCG